MGASFLVSSDARAAVGEPAHAPVGGDHAIHEIPVVARAPGLLARCAHPVSIVWVNERVPAGDGVLGPLVGRNAEDVLYLGAEVVDLDDQRIVLRDRVAVQHHRHALDERLEPILRLLRLALGLAQRCDVDHHALEQQRLPLIVAPLQDRVVDHPDDPSVTVEVAVLELERHAVLDATLRGLLDLGDVVRMYAVAPVGLEPLFDRVAEHVADLLADVGEHVDVLPVACLPQIDDRRDVAEDRSEVRLGALPLGDLDAHELVGLLELRGARAHTELELFVRGGKCHLGLSFRGDVDHHALPSRGIARAIAQQRRLVAHPHNVALRGDQPVLAKPGIAGRGVQVVGGELDLAVVGVEHLGPHVRLVEPFLHGVAEQVLDLAVHVPGGAVVVGVHLVDDGREVLQQRVIAHGRLPAQLVRLDLRGDVDHHALPVAHAGRRVRDGHGVVPHPDVAARRMPEPVHLLEILAGLPGAAPLLDDARTVIGVREAEPLLGGEPFLGRDPEDLLGVRRDVEAPGRRLVGVDVDDDRQVFDEIAERHGAEVDARLDRLIAHGRHRVRRCQTVAHNLGPLRWDGCQHARSGGVSPLVSGRPSREDER